MLPTWQHWSGIPTPDQTLLPNLPALIGYGAGFTLGWAAQRQSAILATWQAQWKINLGLACALSMVCCYFAVAGLRELPLRLLTWRVQDADIMASRTRIAAIVSAVTFLALIAFCLPKATQRLHGNRAANHEAGLWLRSICLVDCR